MQIATFLSATLLGLVLAIPAVAATPQVAVAGYTSMALDSNGVLYGWGDNGEGLLGRVDKAYAPLPVPAGTHFIRGFAGGKQLYLLDNTNGLWGAGANRYGQLGDGTNFERRTGLVKIGDGYTELVAGLWHVLAMRVDGSVWVWGDDTDGQLGDGGSDPRNEAYSLNLGRAISIAAGAAHSLVVLEDGSLWAWGCNEYGQLGDGSTQTRRSPVKIGTGFVQVAAGNDFSLARKADGSVWSWGRNGLGQLGQGSTVQSVVPVALTGKYVQIAASGWTGFALTSSGDLWQWGDPVLAVSSSPLQPQRVAQGVASLSAGSSHLLVQRTDGSLWSAGSNEYGELGIDDADTYRSSNLMPVPVTARRYAAGGNLSLAVLADGSVQVWGDNSEGQLAQGRDETVSVPVQLADRVKRFVLSDSVAYLIRDDGGLWGWGSNREGRLGDGTTRSRSQPVKLGDGYISLSTAGTQSFAIRGDGSLWAWGDNNFGQLGLGDTVSRSVPSKVGDGYSMVAAGAEHTLGLKRDGSLWSWGRNRYGQLGNGQFETRFGGQANPVPQKIGEGFSAVLAGAHHSLALKADGTLWAWGWNDYGQVGDGSLESRATPVKIASQIANLWSAGINNLVLGRDGRTYGWGYNGSVLRAYNMLLTGSIDPVTAPRAIAGEWQAAAAGSSHALYLRRDGTPFAVGYQQFGQLGDGSFDSLRASLGAILSPRIDGLLDLQPGVVKTTSVGEVPSVLFKAFRQSSSAGLSMGVQLFLPATTSAAPFDTLSGNRFAAAGYNIYIAASIPNGDTVTWLMMQPQRVSRTPSWTGIGSPLAAYLENVSSSSASLIVLDVLANMDFSKLAGAYFYIGYGTSADEMLRARRYRPFYAVPAD